MSGVEDLIQSSIREDNLEELKKIIFGKKINVPLKSGWTVLLHACDNGKTSIVDYLLESGALPNVHFELFTPLMAVCNSSSANQEDLLKCAKLLIERGADVDAMDKYKTTALMYACIKGYEKVISVLLEAKCDINKIDNEGSTSLHCACLHKHSNIVRMLLDHGAEKIFKDRRGRTPLDMATLKGAEDIMTMLDDVPNQEDQLEKHAVYIKSKTSFEELLTQLPSYNNPSGKDGFHSDVAILLSGMRLGHKDKNFASRQISLSHFLNIRNDELKDLGLCFSSQREKVIMGNKRFISHPWGPGSMPPVKQPKENLDIMDIVRSLANTVKHLHILWASCLYCNERLVSPETPEKVDHRVYECIESAHSLNNIVLKELKSILNLVENLDKENRVYAADLILPTKQPKLISCGKIVCAGAFCAYVLWKTNVLKFLRR